MVTDPIGDFLVRLKNASRVGRTSILVPATNMNLELTNLLIKQGYVASFEKRPKRYALELTLVYRDGVPAVQDAKRISKPSRRMYMGVRDIKPVKRGRGILVLSTPKGLRTGKDAKAERVGGEVLFELW
jgi:small subunit ribosomal protein S8